MHQRKSLRLKHYDYRQPGYYYLTLCCLNKKHYFGRCTRNQSWLNQRGIIARELRQSLTAHFPKCLPDSFIIMPNHLHCILIISDGNQHPLSTIIGSYKAAVSREIGKMFAGAKLWQRGYWERVIRDERELNHVREYMLNNPARWCLGE
ncbi:transposase [Erwinia aphidicola]|uniref:transposase n=1 Tax=Erwinia TaxID=551 RepID=UPI0014150EBF|nr:transposase [Erwinia aphidicola]MCP2232360.1 REP element-mobilizing transposase RayT [Erwinia aphidicola]